ncbi:hypothetical protein I4U23_017646 [Adineta vaga]|nr:hypothetical protein I4U23_017646 [Adineta vaga]
MYLYVNATKIILAVRAYAVGINELKEKHQIRQFIIAEQQLRDKIRSAAVSVAERFRRYIINQQITVILRHIFY